MSEAATLKPKRARRTTGKSIPHTPWVSPVYNPVVSAHAALPANVVRIGPELGRTHELSLLLGIVGVLSHAQRRRLKFIFDYALQETSHDGNLGQVRRVLESIV